MLRSGPALRQSRDRKGAVPKRRFFRFRMRTLALIVVVGWALVISWYVIYLQPKQRMAANERAAIEAMRTINTAQQQYKTGVTGSRYGTLSSLSAIGAPPFLDTVIGSGTRSGYTFASTVGAGGQSYSVRAGPIEFGRTGSRSFFTNSGAVIFHSEHPGDFYYCGRCSVFYEDNHYCPID